jgi:hypothetical protein
LASPLAKYIIDMIAQLKNWLSHASTYYSSRLIQSKAMLITPVGVKPQEGILQMNTGKQWNWKLLLWKTLMLGLWFTIMTAMEHRIMSYQALGRSSANVIQMDALIAEVLWTVMTVYLKTSFVALWFLAEILSVHRVW